ncbi:MAG: dehydrogenase [Planctomycetes bacterium]|nr:dehydrogenase [Planctomycetota bacterium]
MSIPRMRVVVRTLASLTLLAPVLLWTSFDDPSVDPPTVRAVKLEKGDHICFLGNALAERMQHHGWLESRLQLRLPEPQLSFRNLGFSADALTVSQRTAGFGSWDDYLKRCQADVIFAFFGYNESFETETPKFRTDLAAFIAHSRKQLYNGRSAPRLVLFSPIPFEDTGDRNLPDAKVQNARLLPYVTAMGEVAKANDVPFVDLFSPMKAHLAAGSKRLTINGLHLTDEGNRVLARVIESALLGDTKAPDAGRLTPLRKVVLDKNLRWFNRYRATDGFNVYGGRSHLKFVDGITNRTVLQREMEILDAMCNNRDRRIWAIAQGKKPPTDDPTPPYIRVKTNKPGKGPGGVHIYVDGEKSIANMTVAPGMQVNLFACENQFPELQNPVRMAWDTKGRLWVAVWPTYPHWEPDKPMNDKLLIFEDTDQDGKADVCKTFAGDLHNPTGFEFWGGGVIVAQCPDLVFLKDTDGDDVADHRERVLHGLSSGDTHHAANSFVIGPGGALYFQEGTFHQSQIESVHGPVRNHNGCVWRFDPRTYRVDRYVPYNFANPHGHVFDRWGQDFCTDGTGNRNYYALPFSGYIKHPAKHPGYFTFFQQPSRPSPGTEILSSTHFPEEYQGNYLDANVIGFRGIFQFKVHDADSGFSATQVDSIVSSTDQSFRPSDLEVGPDGALYFIDWYNPIIGHMQHHLRDPSRDHRHGRVYRVTYKGRPLQKPADIAGSPINVLLDLLKDPADRVRYRARIELSARDSNEVITAAKAWIGRLNPNEADYEHHMLEGLWLHQQHNVVNQGLLERVLRSKDYRARAAATRVLRYTHARVNGALKLLSRQARDPHPRVRLEAIVAASFFGSADAVAAALEAKRHPSDRFIDYALKETMRALDPVWKAAIRRGQLVAADNPEAISYLLGLVSDAELVALPRVPAVLRVILTRRTVDDATRLKAAQELAKTEGKSVSAIVVDAVKDVDDHGRMMHGRAVLHALGELLQTRIANSDAPPRADLEDLARNGQEIETQQLAYAGLISIDGDVEASWRGASSSRKGLLAFLGAVPMVTRSDLRASAYEHLRPLMFVVPAGMQTTDESAGVPGVQLAFYRGTPKNAELTTFQELKPETVGRVEDFTIKSPLIKVRDAFGVMFTGTIHCPRGGRYVFFTNSDDGSRLYINGREVVNNDGSHGMKEKKGALRLGAGPHAIAVTYYDQGGGDGLVVSWRGPGFKKRRIPGSALTTGIADTIRAAAIRAIAHAPGNEAEKFQDAARLIGEGSLLESAVYLVDHTPQRRWPAGGVEPVVDAIAAYASGLPKEQRTAPHVVAALETGKRLARSLPDEQAKAMRDRLSGLAGTTLLIRTVPHEMLYDRKEILVEAGKPVAIIFQNNDVMPHNLVITKPGRLKAVGVAAEALDGVRNPNYIPQTDDILWHSSLLLPGATTRVTFVAPETIGRYPYVCTFPGHWRVMNGAMRVVAKLDPNAQPAPVVAKAGTAPARRFVKMWAYADLESKVAPGWTKGRSVANGEAMFTAAGCVKCHWLNGHGIKSAPDLSKVPDKYTAKEMLRHILEPSLAIQEGYETYLIETAEGDLIDGRIVKETADALHVNTKLQDPKAITIIKKSDVEDKTKMTSSAMPTGLLVTLDATEILDLLAWLRSGKE